jgi:hypothetical protein
MSGAMAGHFARKPQGASMINTESAYIEAGYKCARARLQNDEARAAHWRQWFARARDIEKPENRAEARRLFDQGYAEAQPARRPHYFR